MEFFVHSAVDVVEGAEVSRDCEAAVGYCGEEGAHVYVDDGAEGGKPKLQKRVMTVEKKAANAAAMTMMRPPTTHSITNTTVPEQYMASQRRSAR